MRKPSENYAKELLGLGVTVPASVFGDEHAAAEGPHIGMLIKYQACSSSTTQDGTAARHATRTMRRLSGPL